MIVVLIGDALLIVSCGVSDLCLCDSPVQSDSLQGVAGHEDVEVFCRQRSGKRSR